MPFQPINFANIAPIGKPWARNFADNLRQGFEMGNLPQKLMGEKEQQALMNAFNRERVQQAQAETPFAGQNAQNNASILQNTANFAPQMSQADISHRMAQAKSAEQQANMPFGGQLSGVAREAFGLELLKQQYGPESEVYKNALRRYQADLQQSDVLNQYRQALSGTAEKRASTTLGKTEREIEDIYNRQDLSLEAKEAMIDRYTLQRQKQISDEDSRKKALFASNVDKTLDQINPKDLTQYGGAKGVAKLQVDKLKAATGNETKEYANYQKSLTGAKLLAKQIRQFYGDSITPQVQEALSEMVNPATWENNPRIAMDKFNQFKKILQSETETYRGALKNTREFEGKKESSKGKDLTYDPITGSFS